jgi:glycosyltransferase involved in cell wall biosynthesis
VLSIVLPAKNEAESLRSLLPRLRAACPDAQIVVSDDGSSDGTTVVAREAGAEVVRSPYSRGNGAAIKQGARTARGDVIVFLDADGQHDPAEIPSLVQQLELGYDMVVGARDWSGQANAGRGFANAVYNRIASWMTGVDVRDLTSGFRVVRATKFREFLYLLPNGFSYPTTITMAFFRSGYHVAYRPVRVARRVGRSHLRPLHDGVRFLLIIFKVATLYSPLKVFAPISAMFLFGGLANYAYTFVTEGRFTNMSALLLTAAVIVLLIGLLSEQITTLMYRREE